MGADQRARTPQGQVQPVSGCASPELVDETKWGSDVVDNCTSHGESRNRQGHSQNRIPRQQPRSSLTYRANLRRGRRSAAYAKTRIGQSEHSEGAGIDKKRCTGAQVSSKYSARRWSDDPAQSDTGGNGGVTTRGTARAGDHWNDR